MTIDHMVTFNQHYKDIQNYFSVTNTKRNEFDFERQNNSIERARSKLSGLNQIQFFELSTDVHDELQRRITGNGGELGSSLRPIDKFHKKRNQAREKLSSLAEKRFNDLLNDLAQEIERRGYDNIELNDMEKSEDDNISKESITETSTPLKDSTPPHEKEGNNNDDAIQQTVIIPMKASIDWSSDEDEEEEQEEKLPNEVESTEAIEVLEEPELDFNTSVQDKLATKISEDEVEKKIDDDLNETLGRSISLTKVSTTRSLSSTEFEAPPISATSKNFADDEDDFDFNQPLTHVNFGKELNIEHEDKAPKNVQNETIDKDDVASLKEENNKLKHELNSLKDHSTYPKATTTTSSQFKQYIDKSGHVPLILVKDFQNLTTRLYSIVNDSDEQRDQDEFGKDLFTKVFQISKNIHEIMLLSSVPEVANEIILLKASLSHLITSIRYYCSFKDLLPKITVNTSIADLSFSFCNLISVVKIKAVIMNDELITRNEYILNANDETLINENDTTHILSPNLSSKVKPLRLAEKLQNFDSSSSLVDESDNTVATSSSGSSNIRSNPNKGLLFDRIDVKSVTPSPERRTQREVVEVKLSTSESLLEDISNSSPTPNRTMEMTSKAPPTRNKSFMDKLKQLKHIGAK
ncbi:hypothetical protein MOUN0_K09384 [Monosporozyma unispora]